MLQCCLGSVPLALPCFTQGDPELDASGGAGVVWGQPGCPGDAQGSGMKVPSSVTYCCVCCAAKERLRALAKLISTPRQARQALVAAARTAALRSMIRPRKVAHAKVHATNNLIEARAATVLKTSSKAQLTHSLPELRLGMPLGSCLH